MPLGFDTRKESESVISYSRARPVSLIERTSRERESERSSRIASASEGVFTIVTSDPARSSCLRRTARYEFSGIWRYRVLNGVE